MPCLPVTLDGLGLILLDITKIRQLHLHISTQHDIGTATRHIGGNGYGSRLACLGNNVCLTLMLLGVQDLVYDIFFTQQIRKIFRGLDRRRTHQNRLLARPTRFDIVDDRIVLLFLRTVDQVRKIIPDHWLVSGDNDYFQAIDLLKLRRFGICGARHARQLAIQAEQVLKGY